MVATGQFLERPALVACGELTLDGLYHRGQRPPAVLVCPPLGPGGGMDAPPVAELAWACARAGHPSLRFQHRGVGASTGEPDPARALDDALAALAHLAESGGVARLAVAGVGSSCATALQVARAIARVSVLVLAAPAGPPDLSALAALAARTLVLWPGEGAGPPPPEPEGGAVRVEVIDEADPLFRKGLPAMGRRAVEWLQTRR